MFKWSSQTTFLTLVGVVALMVLSITLFSVGFLAGQTIGARQALIAARDKVSKVLPAAPEEVFSLSGTVKEVRADSFVIEAAPFSSNPLDAQGPTERVVKVGGTTVLQQLNFKSAGQIQKESEAYRAALTQADAAGVATPSAPMPYSLTSLVLSDLGLGDLVTVNAKVNVRDVKEFEASEVNRTQKAQ